MRRTIYIFANRKLCTCVSTCIILFEVKADSTKFEFSNACYSLSYGDNRLVTHTSIQVYICNNWRTWWKLIYATMHKKKLGSNLCRSRRTLVVFRIFTISKPFLSCKSQRGTNKRNCSSSNWDDKQLYIARQPVILIGRESIVALLGCFCTVHIWRIDAITHFFIFQKFLCSRTPFLSKNISIRSSSVPLHHPWHSATTTDSISWRNSSH